MKISPEELALKVDAFKEHREQRLALQREVDNLKETEQRLKEELVQMFQDSGIQGLTGKLAMITLVSKTVPVVQDWDALYAHIETTGHFDLLERRLGKKAVQARWDEDHEVPGVNTETFYDLSIRKPIS